MVGQMWSDTSCIRFWIFALYYFTNEVLINSAGEKITGQDFNNVKNVGGQSHRAAPPDSVVGVTLPSVH